MLPFIRVGWSWVEPPARVKQVKARRFRLEEEVIPQGRGLRDEVVRRIVVGDVFGLARIAWRTTEHRAIRVLPSVGGLRQMHVVRSLAGGEDISHPEGTPEGERIDLRRYVPGDPIRFILWKVFAKTRDVIVRTPERALEHARQTVASLVAGDGDEPAAGAARVAIDVGALGGEWVFGADGVPSPARAREEALEVLAKSSSAKPDEHGAGLGEFLRTASPGGGGRAVVFVPGRPGAWLDNVVRSAAKVGQGQMGTGFAPMEFIVCTDGIERASKRGWIGRAMLRRPTGPDDDLVPVLSSELTEVLSKLGALRARILVIDRRDGRVFGQEHQRRMEAA